MDENQQDFTRFVIEHEKRLLGTAYLLTGDTGHAEDLLQTALAKSYQHWRRVRRTDNPFAYVRRVLVNTHISWRRRLMSRERVVDVILDIPDAAEQPDLALRVDVRRALLSLSPRVRAVIVLRYYEDLTERETAQLLGCSISTVGTHATRGLTALRRALATQQATQPSIHEGRR